MRKKLTEEAPHLAKEWMVEKNDRPIYEITAGSKYKAWWKCKTCEYQWESRVQSRARGSGCVKCAGRHGKSLLQEAPHLLHEWMTEKNDRPIEGLTAGSAYKAWWKCKDCHNEWVAVVANRVRGGGCRPCSHSSRKKQPYIIDEHENLTKEWVTEKNDRPIDEITAGSHYKAWWECETCKKQWEAKVYSRVGGNNCPKCAGKHGTYLLQEAPHLLHEWMTEKNDRPIEGITAGSKYKAKWKCKACHNQWEAMVHDRVKGNSCPKCAGKHGTYLLQEAPHLLHEWMTEKNDRPIEGLTAGSAYKAWWKCKDCHNEWKTMVKSRVHGTRCSKCVRSRKPAD